MQTQTINGFKITIFNSYNGTQLFINDKDGVQIYGHKVSGDPMERAKEIIRNYYQQVEKANILFTNYKEGWKTDQGMVYIIFGLPTSVNESQETEEWIYNNETLKVKFTFDKLGNLFTDKHYDLVRKENYDKVWFRMVDSWRKGRSEI